MDRRVTKPPPQGGCSGRVLPLWPHGLLPTSNVMLRYQPAELGKCLVSVRERDAPDWPCCQGRSGSRDAVVQSVLRQFGGAANAQPPHHVLPPAAGLNSSALLSAAP